MAYTAVVQNIRSMVHPEFLFAQILYRWDLQFLPILRDKVFDFSIVIFNYLMETFGNNGSRMNNTSDLCSEVVLLSAEEEWVSEYGSFEITREEDLNLARSLDVGGAQIGQLRPLL